MPATAIAIALGDAIWAELSEDVELAGLARAAGVTVQVVAATDESERTPAPYVVVGRRTLQGTGFAMQVEGGESDVVLDTWSAFNGPEEAQDIQARIRTLLLRDPAGRIQARLAAAGVEMFGGSLVCPEETVFKDWDPEMPTEGTRYHGVQRWQADLEAR